MSAPAFRPLTLPRQPVWIAVLSMAFALGHPAWAADGAVLVPVHRVGACDDRDVDSLVDGFVAELEARGAGGLARLEGEGCATPDGCGAEVGAATVYWIQLSGAGDRRIGVAARLDASGAVVDRHSVEATRDELPALGRELAAAVAAGEGTGLDVITDTTGAQVLLDGEPLGETPLTLDSPLAAGEHLLTVEDPRGATAVTRLDVRAGERARVELDLSTVPGLEPPRRARVWPLLPLLAGGAVAAILVATDPAGIVGPDYRITVSAARP